MDVLELYNFVLIGLTDELVELGVPSSIKLTVLQLWATYLGKLEVAFISTKKKAVQSWLGGIVKGTRRLFTARCSRRERLESVKGWEAAQTLP